MASKRRLRRRGCESKIRHTSHPEAVIHARKLGWPWTAYGCKFCNGFHVGRPDKNKKRALIAKHGYA